MKTDYLLHDEVYQRKRHDSAYAGWNKAEGLAEDIQNMWQPLMQRDAFPKQGKLLELGCGAGNLSLYFAKAGYEATGIDIAPTAIEWARENAASAQVDIQFIQGDVLTLADFADESFDIALDGHCFTALLAAIATRFCRRLTASSNPVAFWSFAQCVIKFPTRPVFENSLTRNRAASCITALQLAISEIPTKFCRRSWPPILEFETSS